MAAISLVICAGSFIYGVIERVDAMGYPFVFCILPVLWVADKMVGGIESYRTEHNRCPVCGYDLRASKERCPECGNPISQAPPV